MGAIYATLRAFKDMEEVKTVDPAGVRAIFLRIAIRGAFLFVIYLALFIFLYYKSAASAMQANCADAGAEVCYVVYVFVSVYGSFFLFMLIDVVLACLARSMATSRLCRVGMVTNVVSALLYIGGKSLCYEVLLSRDTKLPTWTIALGCVLVFVVSSYKCMCAIILRNLARRFEAGGAEDFGLQRDAPMGALDAPMLIP